MLGHRVGSRYVLFGLLGFCGCRFAGLWLCPALSQPFPIAWGEELVCRHQGGCVRLLPVEPEEQEKVKHDPNTRKDPRRRRHPMKGVTRLGFSAPQALGSLKTTAGQRVIGLRMLGPLATPLRHGVPSPFYWL